jgi:hypothetical protein
MVLTVIETERPEAPLRRRYWRCGGCRKIIGEVIGDQLLIARGAHSWVVPLTETTGARAHCGCGRDNEITGRTAAEIVTGR